MEEARHQEGQKTAQRGAQTSKKNCLMTIYSSLNSEKKTKSRKTFRVYPPLSGYESYFLASFAGEPQNFKRESSLQRGGRSFFSSGDEPPSSIVDPRSRAATRSSTWGSAWGPPCPNLDSMGIIHRAGPRHRKQTYCIFQRVRFLGPVWEFTKTSGFGALVSYKRRILVLRNPKGCWDVEEQ